MRSVARTPPGSILYKDEVKLTYNGPRLMRYSNVDADGGPVVGTIVIYFTAVQTGVSTSELHGVQSGVRHGHGRSCRWPASPATSRPSSRTLDMAAPIMEIGAGVRRGKQVLEHCSGRIRDGQRHFPLRRRRAATLDDLSLKIRPGQSVGVVGKTGCGKSTLMRLLLGFEKPQKGAVLYDGRDIETLDVASLRRNIGTVLQDGKLFTGDIFSNIVAAAPWLTMEDAGRRPSWRGSPSDIRAMPMGMNTMVSEGAGGISGGQRQRILIARAVAPKPKVLFFDEATSALDNVTQRQVSEALDRMKCTRIIVAHRLSNHSRMRPHHHCWTAPRGGGRHLRGAVRVGRRIRRTGGAPDHEWGGGLFASGADKGGGSNMERFPINSSSLAWTILKRCPAARLCPTGPWPALRKAVPGICTYCGMKIAVILTRHRVYERP